MKDPNYANFARRFGWPDFRKAYPLAIGHRGASGHARENTLKRVAGVDD